MSDWETVKLLSEGNSEDSGKLLSEAFDCFPKLGKKSLFYYQIYYIEKHKHVHLKQKGHFLFFLWSASVQNCETYVPARGK
jgi:hypothetical protein